MKNSLAQKMVPAIADQTIRINRETAAKIRQTLDGLIGNRSFHVDACAEIMGDIGAAALGPFLNRAERQMLEDFGRGIGEQPFVILEGLPQQADLPPTPSMYGDDAAVQFTDSLLLATMRLARLQPVAYSYENDGRLFRNVSPVRQLRANSSWGYRDPLEWHIDNAYAFENAGFMGDTQTEPHESPAPQTLFFAGLRNQDGRGRAVPTEILKAADVVRNAPQKLVQILQQPLFSVKPGASNIRPPMNRPMPLLERSPTTGEWLLRFNANPLLTVGFTKRAQVAVAELCQLLDDLEELMIPVMVSPGMIFAIHNYRVLHRRKQFSPGTDWSNARWLRRCFGCSQRRHGQQLDAVNRPFVWK